jgi:DNA-binding MarR family transcriptional regulator
MISLLRIPPPKHRDLPPPSANKLADADYRALADFRFQIRQFLHFSELAAHSEGLQPQQHQLLLAARALTVSRAPTIGELAGHLLIQHHSAVGLTDRLAERGLVERVRGSGDRRQVRIRLTAEGERTLARLSSAHRTELLNSGPRLVVALAGLLRQPREESKPNEEHHVSETSNP